MIILAHAVDHSPIPAVALQRGDIRNAPVIAYSFPEPSHLHLPHHAQHRLCPHVDQPRSGSPQPGSQIGLVDHRGAAETWWRLSAPQRAKWQLVLDTLGSMPVDDQHRPTLPLTPELEGVLRLTLPWMPRPVWPEWCRRLYALKAGVLVHADGSQFRAALGKAPPAGMIE